MKTANLMILGAIVFSETNAQSETKLPNILWIVAEDMNAHLGCYGDSAAKTPNIDNFAKDATVYTQAYSAAPVSAPSRCAMITGMYPSTIGGHHMRTMQRSSADSKLTDSIYNSIPLYEATPPEGVKCFTEYLRKIGYFCSNNAKTDYQFETPITAWDECSKDAHYKNRKQGQPFFAVFNLEVCHESKIWERATDSLLIDTTKLTIPSFYPNHHLIRKDIARHYSNITEMDKQFGKLIEELKTLGLWENTIVFFYGDNGDGLPRYKRSLYDGGIKMPLIIRVPNDVNNGKKTDRLISFVDFAPTILSLTNLKKADYMVGLSFLGKFKDNERKYVFATADRMDVTKDCNRAVRDKRYKYIRNLMTETPYVQNIPYRNNLNTMKILYEYETKNLLDSIQKLWFAKTKPTEELYDIENDPYELTNLSTNPLFQNKLKEMRNVYFYWSIATKDLNILPETDLVKKLWSPNGIQPTVSKPDFVLNRKNKLEIFSNTPGVSIAWRIKGDKNWNLYIEPLPNVKSNIEAIACRIGYKKSEISYFSNK